jgi:uncharacterized membrane protein YkvA (DUF1232 family)
MRRIRSGWQEWVVGVGLATLLAVPFMPTTSAAHGLPLRHTVVSAHPGVVVSAASSALAPNVDRDMQRTVTRAERSMSRLGLLLEYALMLWLWAAVNTAVFLLVAAIASIADVRMFSLWREGAGVMLRYLANGGLTFVRLLFDRRSPYWARVVIGVAFFYWLLPTDFARENFYLLSDESGVSLAGMIDDLVVTIIAAKVFMYLCPDALVAQHAAAVKERAHATA